MSSKVRHWRFKKAANTVAMDLCTSTRAMRSITNSIVFQPLATVTADCPACLKIIRVEMPELV